MPTADEFLESTLDAPAGAGTYGAGIDQAAKTSKKNYSEIYRFINFTSHSSLNVLHDCARSWKFTKMIRSETGLASSFENGNVDFAFGHSVGAGIQAYIVSGNRNAALFAAFLAWNIDLNLEHEKKKKSAVFAHLAVLKFIAWWNSSFGKDWEVAVLNGRAASEITFLIDLENGGYHVGHVDVVLQHKATGKFMVLELKTTASKIIDEAQYGNSDQALSYSLVLDKIAGDGGYSGVYEVLYIVYSSTNREFVPLLFTKDKAHRADWLQSILLDHSIIQAYESVQLFPKNGDGCWKFNRRCPHYGLCDMRSYNTGTFRRFKLGDDPLPEPTDFIFTLTELKNATA